MDVVGKYEGNEREGSRADGFEIVIFAIAVSVSVRIQTAFNSHSSHTYIQRLRELSLRGDLAGLLVGCRRKCERY